MSEKHNEICLKGVNEILGMSFYIPDYQRGYRWGKQQVEDLLNDINEFKEEGSNFYCLQPLVVRNRQDEKKILSQIKETNKLSEVKRLLEEKKEWEIIDGQQRLTTLFVILKAMGIENPYNLEYQTRPNSKDFLKELAVKNMEVLETKAKENIDFYHIFNAFKTVTKWLKEKTTNEEKYIIEKFKEKILDHVKFIWYESKEENPIEVFTRLNIGKIGLTNAELIKALILNSSNFNKSDIQVRQETIALEWDNIEYTLQNDEFWYFLNNIGNEKATRIDFIFDIIKDQDYLNVKKVIFQKDNEGYDKAIGNDSYQTFRYFYEYFKKYGMDEKTGEYITKEKLLKEAWDKVKEIFRTFKEWYDDLEFYHYIGFLINFNKRSSEIITWWNGEGNHKKDKEQFKNTLINKIKKQIEHSQDLEKIYDIDGATSKTECRSLLLLHNIQTIINQNKLASKDYGEQIFQKFPFHIFKKEKWDVEHIDSNTENQLNEFNDQKEWLRNSLVLPALKKEENKSLIQEILNFINSNDNNKDNPSTVFSKLKEKIEDKIGENAGDKLQNEEEKNKIWNFVLLDQTTNRSYGNALFSAKRRIIIGKEQGKIFIQKIIGGENKEEEKDAESAFIPPCTRNVFMKFYSLNSSSNNIWSVTDAKDYRENIMKTLKEFEVK